MIQKRYEFIGRTGVTWTNWFDYCEDDRALSRFQEEEKFHKYYNEWKDMIVKL